MITVVGETYKSNFEKNALYWKSVICLFFHTPVTIGPSNNRR